MWMLSQDNRVDNIVCSYCMCAHSYGIPYPIGLQYAVRDKCSEDGIAVRRRVADVNNLVHVKTLNPMGENFSLYPVHMTLHNTSTNHTYIVRIPCQDPQSNGGKF